MTDLLRRLPRVRLAHLPTPLERCDRLREAVGGPPIWIKRDDCTGLGGGGNKTRKLEFLLGRAVAEGADGVVTFGAVQSNHARQTAAACARLGLSCDLILTQAVPLATEHYLTSGNVMLDRLFGATLHLCDDTQDVVAALREIEGRAASGGRTLFTIGPGGSDATGTLGYVEATFELADQCRDLGIDLSRIVVAASTCGTAAGLALGASLAGLSTFIDVAAVYHSAEETEGELRALVTACADGLGVDPPPDEGWAVTDRMLGPGYGLVTDECLRAIEVLARTEGVLLDPVYTGKAFALLLDRIANGELDGNGPVVFLHTGGAPALSAYADVVT